MGGAGGAHYSAVGQAESSVLLDRRGVHRQSLFLEWRRFEVIFRIQQQSYIYKVSNSPSTVVDMRMSSHAAVCESSNNGIETGPCYIKDLHDRHGRVIIRQTAGSEIRYNISIPAPAIHTRRGA